MLLLKSLRILHWIHSRIGFFQLIAFLLWLGERSTYESAPPMATWLVYFHVVVCFLGSTGLSARFLPRISTWLMVTSHLHIAYLYLYEYRLAYPSWLRFRLAWRSALSIAVYLRMLGVTDPTASSRTGLRGSESLGLVLLAVATGAVGAISLPTSVLNFHEELQLVDTDSTWQAKRLGWAVGLLSGGILLLASLSYSLCLFVLPVSGGKGSWSSRYLLSERSTLFADCLTVIAFITLSALRDCNMNYWKTMDVEFWLQVRLLLDNFVLISGIVITHHLLHEYKDNISSKSPNLWGTKNKIC